MASPQLPPPKKKFPQPAPTTILALGDDLLREVFLRLPSLSSLVRAALASPAFLRAVRSSSPAFRRRFRELHWPPLLGVFLVNEEAPTLTFAPVLLRGRCRRSHPDQAAALRGLDVFLTLLPNALDDIKEDEEENEEEAADEDEEDAEDEDGEDDEDEEEEEWSMSGCHDGYILLVTPRLNTKKVAVYDPVTRALDIFPGPPDELFSGDPEDTEPEFHLISSQGDDRSFRVLCVCKEDGGARVAVLSPENREWQISPTAGRLPADEGNGTFVNGSVYWASEDGDNVLNTATLQFSQIDLPPRAGSYGETKDGKLCLVRGSDLELDVWVRRAGDDGVDTWMQDTFQMLDAIDKLPSVNVIAECPELNVVAIIGGIVYFAIHQDDPPIWLLSLCLETGEVKKLCRITSYESCYPYIMAWPPSLVRNKAGAV